MTAAPHLPSPLPAARPFAVDSLLPNPHPKVVQHRACEERFDLRRLMRSGLVMVPRYRAGENKNKRSAPHAGAEEAKERKAKKEKRRKEERLHSRSLGLLAHATHRMLRIDRRNIHFCGL